MVASVLVGVGALAQPDQLTFRLQVADCVLALEVATMDDAIPLRRLQVRAGGAVVHDSGQVAVPAFAEVVPLDLSPGIHPIEVLVWNGDAYAETPYRQRHRIACQGQTATATLPVTVGARSAAVPAVVAAAATAAAPAVETATPTPLPPTATPSPTATASPAAPPTATPTHTPVYTLWLPSPPTATPLPTATLPPLPAILRGKILFRSDRDVWMANSARERQRIEQEGEIFVMNPDGSEVGKLTSIWPYLQAAAGETLSGDGQFKLFVQRDANGPQIFYHNTLYGNDQQVSRQGAGAAFAPAFAPDGWRIAFVSSESGNDELWTINRDGGEARQLTHNEWEWDKHPSWSPDGAQIVFYSNRTGKRQLYIMAADGSGVRPLSDGHGEDWDPIWVK